MVNFTSKLIMVSGELKRVGAVGSDLVEVRSETTPFVQRSFVAGERNMSACYPRERDRNGVLGLEIFFKLDRCSHKNT